jgi:dissimilatory sulfite reductase (desulfoviridin) alpha/beta subunit
VNDTHKGRGYDGNGICKEKDTMKTDHFIEDQEDRVPVEIAVEGQTGALDFSTLKTGGIIKQKQKDLFTVRLKCPGGRVSLDRLDRIAAVARRYAGDYVHLTVRQSIEIPFVHFGDLGPMKSQLGEVGQEIASCGPRVRVPTACAGCDYNPKGLTNTQQMAARVCDQFFGKRPLPHKFKVGFAGCPNDCSRSSLMDIGFQGAIYPAWKKEVCNGCRICASGCVEGAIESHPETGEPIFHAEKCLYCGDCLRCCPTEAWVAEKTGWIVRVGAKHGRHPIAPTRIAEFVPDEKIPEIIQATLDWYEKHGRGKGRVRIGALLLDEALWKDFLAFMKPVLGEYAIDDPPPPRKNESHF